MSDAMAAVLACIIFFVCGWKIGRDELRMKQEEDENFAALDRMIQREARRG